MQKKTSSAPTATKLKIQNLFFTKLKEVLPESIAMADEIADLLNVSTDSAYRRMRGETELTIEEVYTITQKYPISIDEVFGNLNNRVTFSYTKLTDSKENFKKYLEDLLGQLRVLSKAQNKKLYYVAEEMPIFYSFFSKKLTEFKLFYWQRSVLNLQEFQNEKFKFDLVDSDIVKIARDCFEEYLRIPSVEIWTTETVQTGLKQIQFYYESGIISKTQAFEILSEYKSMIELIFANATDARKNKSDKDETFFFYCSEVVLGTNCIYVLYDNSKISYISFNTMNSLATANPQFCEETEHWLKNLEKKSTLISGVSEKLRYKFFTTILNLINTQLEQFEK